MTIETNSPEFRAVLDTVRILTIQECKRELATSDTWISIKAACVKIGISRGLLKNLIDEKKIKAKHIGRAVRISSASIEKHMNNDSLSENLL